MGVVPKYARGTASGPKRPGARKAAAERRVARQKQAHRKSLEEYKKKLGLAVLPRPVAVRAPQPIELPVPIPAKRERADGLLYACRPMQAVFRLLILGAYNSRCAVTGCAVTGALQAAHIIPYVDERSNLVINGLCLRADIHQLYDRNLLTIDGGGFVHASPDLNGSAYAVLRGRQITMPTRKRNRPDPQLLAVRHQFISGNGEI